MSDTSGTAPGTATEGAGFQEFLQSLLALLSDEDSNIVRYAARALGDYDSENVRRELFQKLAACSPECVPEIVATLRRLHAPGEIDLFHLLMRNSGVEVRTAALEQLAGGIGPAEFPRVRELLGRESDSRCVASLLSLLGRLEPKLTADEVAPFLAHEDARVRANAVELLGRLPPPLNSAAAERMLGDPAPRVRANAMRLLWPERGDALWLELREELASHDERRELSAVYLLGQVPAPPESMAYLIERLGSPSQPVRLLASKSLLTCQGPVDCVTLCARYLEEPHEGVRQNLMACCRKFDAVASVEMLARLLCDRDQNPQARATAARALGDLGDSRAIPMLVVALKDSDPRVRSNAIDALSQCPCDGMMEILLPCLEDPNHRVQATTALAVWRLGGRQTVAVLLGMLRSGDPRKQSSAAFALGEIGHGEMVEPLTELLDELTGAVVTTEAQRQVQKHVMKALTKIRSK